MPGRRAFLKTGLRAVVAGPVVRPARPTATAARTGYRANRTPLQAAPFLRLPPGAIRAHGWLATQLDRQVGGGCGRYPEVSHFLQDDNPGWIHSNLGGWEEGPH